MSFFPLFINIKDMKVLCIGAGNIGMRRINMLVEHGAKVTVITKDNIEIDKAEVHIRYVTESDISSDYNMVIAATDNMETNKSIIEKAIKSGIKYYNNISDKSMCNFYFPAVIENNDVICGLISKNGTSHKKAKDYAAYIRDVL